MQAHHLRSVLRTEREKNDGRIVSQSAGNVKIAATDCLVQDVNFLSYKISLKIILILVCTEIFSREQDFR